MANNYYTLLSSLPYIRSLFGYKIVPLSRYQLNKRLSILSESEKKILFCIESLIFWEHIDPVDDRQLIRFASETVASIKSYSLRDFILYELNRHTLIMAIRLKQKKEAAPTDPRWSYGTYCQYIKRNWSSPTLGLHYTFPEINDIAEAISKEEVLKAEKIILKSMWQHADTMARKHSFDFEAVVVYIMRWNLIQRWVSYDKEQAVSRFSQLVDNELRELTNNFLDNQ